MKKGNFWLWIVFAVSASVFVFFSCYAVFETGWSTHINFELGRNYGSLIGGIFSFISIFLVVINLRLQSVSFGRNQFENKFFQMIAYHRDNVSNMTHRRPDSPHKMIVEGNMVFVYIQRQIENAIILIKPNFLNRDLKTIYLESELAELSDRMNFIRQDVNQNQLALYDIAYLVTFFGIHSEGEEILKRILKPRYQPVLIEKVLSVLREQYVEYDDDETTGERTKPEALKSKIKFFGGHQIRLGHYFRHIYQTINYVNDAKGLTYREKYEYVKTLRAQLSTFEEAVFFYNSISQLGRIWEYYPDCPENSSAKVIMNKKLVTKYNLIKNIPCEHIFEINLNKFYPDVVYEGAKKDAKRKALEKNYS